MVLFSLSLIVNFNKKQVYSYQHPCWLNTTSVLSVIEIIGKAMGGELFLFCLRALSIECGQKV